MFSSLGNDGDFLPPPKKGDGKVGKVKKDYPLFDFPLDCIGVIIQFSDSPTVVNNFCLSSKAVNNYILKENDITKRIKYTMIQVPVNIQPHVGYLVVEKSEMDKCIKNEDLVEKFPNLVRLTLVEQEEVTDEIFSSLNKIERLHLECCKKIGSEGFKHLSTSLKSLVLDKSHDYHDPCKNDGKLFQHLVNLEHLELINIYYDKLLTTDDLLPLTKIKKFRSRCFPVSSRVLKVWKDLEDLSLFGVNSWNPKRFKYCKKLHKLEVIQCRRLPESKIKENLKPFPEDYEYVQPRSRRGRFKRPDPMSDSDGDDDLF